LEQITGNPGIYPLVNIQKLWNVAIEIVDLPIKKCDFS
jgi:hypothetical protein